MIDKYMFLKLYKKNLLKLIKINVLFSDVDLKN